MQPAWADLQAAFARGLMSGEPPARDQLIECGGPGLRGGFTVYRNNSLSALIDALHERFPVTRQLVGEEFFRAMAGAYAREHRPRAPLLMHYGDELPAFIDAFTPAGGLPYLSDVARLEVAWSEAYHAPEACALTASTLIDFSADALLHKRLTLHPSVRVLRSPHPAADIWVAHQRSGAKDALAAAQIRPKAQDAVVVRPDADVNVHVLGSGAYAFLRALLTATCLHEAATRALIEHAGFDAGTGLVDLFGIGAVIALSDAEAQEIRGTR